MGMVSSRPHSLEEGPVGCRHRKPVGGQVTEETKARDRALGTPALDGEGGRGEQGRWCPQGALWQGAAWRSPKARVARAASVSLALGTDGSAAHSEGAGPCPLQVIFPRPPGQIPGERFLTPPLPRPPPPSRSSHVAGSEEPQDPRDGQQGSGWEIHTRALRVSVYTRGRGPQREHQRSEFSQVLDALCSSQNAGRQGALAGTAGCTRDIQITRKLLETQA